MHPVVVEPTLGAIDGVNDTYVVTSSYAPGSLLIFLNGMAANPDGWTELGGNQFQMATPPLVGDRLLAYYRPI